MCLAHQRDEGGKVIILVKDIGATVSPIEDVINISTP